MSPFSSEAAARRNRRRWPMFMALIAVFAMACAIEVPPSGGPVDKTPPSVLSSTPAPDSTGVAPDAPLRFEFSEKMTKTALGRQIQLEPEATISRERWDGQTLIVEFDGGLNPETTYVVTLRPGFKDNHGVTATTEYRFAFSTSAAIDTGRINGRILFRREPTGNAIVRCFELPVDSGFVPEATRPDRETRTDDAGVYTLDYLPTRDRRFIVWAFENKGNDSQFDVGKDFGESFADTVVLSEGLPSVDEVDIWIIDPGEPGKISGRVLNETGIDTMATSVALFAAADTLRPSYYGKCDTDGSFEFPSVKAGTYAFRAFIDMAADSVCGEYPCGPDSVLTCTEPCTVLPDSLVLAPGDEIRVPGFRIGPLKQ